MKFRTLRSKKKYRDKFIKVLIHPFFIGLVITVIILCFAMPEVSRYRVEMVERIPTERQRNLFFSDLDQDGNSEEIVMNVIPGMLKLMLLRDSRVIEQFNLRSVPLTLNYFSAGDYNHDGFNELYYLTMRNDSIFLSILDPLVKRNFIVRERLVFHSDTISFENEAPETRILQLVKSGYGSNEQPVFSLSAGFNLQPRRILRYDIDRDHLEISPLSGVSIHNALFSDLDRDSIPEIILSTFAPGNYQSYVPYSDHSSWLMVLDEDLNFLFPPVEFPGDPSVLKVSPLTLRYTTFLAVLHYYFGTDSIQSGLYVFDHNGRPVRSREMEFTRWGNRFLVTGESDLRPLIYVLDPTKQEIKEFDENLNLIRVRETPPLRSRNEHFDHDLDNDGIPEMIWMGEKRGTFVVFRKGFKYPVTADFGETSYMNYFCNLYRNGEDLFYVQYPDAGYIAEYEKNPYYYLKFPLSAVMWLLTSLFVLLIFRLQTYRAQRQYMTRRKINELQILSLKNQIDPHFTFNILNAIGSLYIKGADRSKAYNIFVKYSDLLRQTIKNSDQVSVSMEEEIRFIENYIELEQIRSDYSFQCNVHIDNDVDMQKKIPRMLIYSFVENSIKHGIRKLKQEGRLEISITRADHRFEVSIRDNGPGLNVHTDTRNGTGKGMHIIDELIALFSELEGSRISYTMKDLSSEGTGRTGTEVLILIPER